MQLGRISLLTILIALLLTACSSLFPIQRQPEPPLSCSPNLQQDAELLLISSGLVCTGKNMSTPFPVTSRKIPSLSYPLFTEQVRNTGVDNPLSFWQDGYAGLYQIDLPVTKNVIIYINGYNGRPTGWKTVYASLEELPLTHIFFNYPTGDSLETTSTILMNLLLHNADKLQGKHITLLAHSQGGLIAVRATQLLTSHTTTISIKHIITITTPWQGCNLAGYAKLINPVSPKVFEDIDMESDFLHTIKNISLPSQTQYSLIHASTFETAHTAYPTDELFSRTNQCGTGKLITPTKTYGVIASHSTVLTSEGLHNLLQKIVFP